MKTLIVGYGFVGKATQYLFREALNFDIDIHDPAQGYTAKESLYDYIFLCVPTDLDSGTKKLSIATLKEVYEEWKDKGRVVIRSTIGPDQVEQFPEAIIMPEFLREKHWKEDVDDKELPIIIGGEHVWCEPLYLKTCSLNKGDTIFVGAKQASMYKMARNSALAMRVALANEFKEICDKLDIDYDILTGMLSRDKVIGGTHWQVPGPDGKLGFGGKCLPKDLTHMSTLCYNEYNIMDDAIKANMIRKIREIGTFLDAAHAHFQ